MLVNEDSNTPLIMINLSFDHLSKLSNNFHFAGDDPETNFKKVLTLCVTDPNDRIIP